MGDSTDVASAFASSEERLRLFVENVPAGVAMFDRDMRYLFASAKYAEIYSLSSTDLVGRLHTDVFPDIPDRWKAVWQRCLEGAVERAKDDPFPRADGTLDYVDWEIRPWRDARGEIGGIVLLSEVVTERRRAAEALRRSEERFRTIFERAPVGIAELDAVDGRLVRANGRFAAILGVPAFELRGATFTELVDETERASLREDLEALAKQPSLRLDRELHLRAGAGRRAWVALTLTATDAGDAILATAIDITRRRAVESAAHAADQRWLATIHGAPLAIAVAKVDGTIVDVNPAFERLFGWSRDSIVGRSSRELGMFADPAQRETVTQRLNESGRSASFELRLRRKTGEELQVRGHAVSIVMDGEACLVSMLEDASGQAPTDGGLREASVAFDSAPVGMCLTSPGTARWLVVNKRLCEMLGYTREELLQRNILDITHPDDRERDAGTADALEAGQMTEVRRTKRYLRRDGTALECEINVTVLPHREGEPVRAVAVILDVADKLRAHERAREAEERWAATIEALPLGVSIARMSDGRIIAANLAFTRMSGYAAEELIGKTADEVGMAVEAEERRRLFEAAVRDGHAALDVLHFRNKSGEERRAALTVSRTVVGGVPCIVVIVRDTTAEHRAEESMRARERAIIAAFEGAPIGLAFAHPAERRLVTVNERMCQMFGYSKDALLAKDVLDLSPPEDRPLTAIAMRRLVEGREPEVALMKRYLRSDGTSFECAVRAVRLPSELGEPVRVVVGFTDVSESREAKRAAKLAEERWTATMEAAHVAIVVTAVSDHRILDLNPECERLTGYARAELLGRPATEIGLSPSASGDSLVHRRGDGVRRCTVSTAPMVFDGEAANVSVVTDVTERREAEEALATSEERYRQLVERIEEPIVSASLDGVITYVNPAIGRFGYTPSDLLGEHSEILLRKEDQARARSWRKEVEEGRPPSPRERIIIDKNGKPRPIRHTPHPIVRDGRVVGMTSVLTDLTAQREVEEQLRTSQRMEAVGRLAGGVAHDFNNLLTVILSYADIARSELPPGSPTQACLDEVVQAGKRAESLTRQLLAFSRKQIMVLEPLSLQSAVGSVSSMLRRLIGENIELVVRAPSNLPLVKVDRGQLEQVIMNLVINARDAMPDGGSIAIEAQAAALDEGAAKEIQLPPGDYLELSVHDDGTGMDEATRERIFEPFFTTKPLGKGTGLGLSTVYGIVKQFGGGIAVDSKPGLGTTFRIYLPRSSGDSAPSELRPAAGGARAASRGECILVVEDDAALRRVLRRILENAGYRVIVHASPQEAIDACRTLGAEIDLVLTDVVMPEMNGQELAKRIHAFAPSMRVVYMSGYTDDTLERLDVLHGNFIRKPFASGDLRRVIGEILERG